MTDPVQRAADAPTVVLQALDAPETIAVPAGEAEAAGERPPAPPGATRVQSGPLPSDRRVVGVLVAVEGEFQGAAWALLEGANRLGREYSCEICMPTERLAPRHASIELLGGRFHLEMLADDEALLGGQPLRSGVLRDGDTLRVGMTTLRFRSIVDS